MGDIKSGINKRLGVILVASICVLTVLVACLSGKLGTIYATTTGDPREILTTFFQSLQADDLTQAYSCLYGNDDIGLAILEDPEANQTVMKALRKSYKAVNIGDVRVDGLGATGQVTFRYLDMELLKQKVEAGMEPGFEYFVNYLSADEVYDDNGEYQAAFIERVYNYVLDDVLGQGELLYTEKTYDAELVYTEDGWKVVLSSDMLNCLLGGKNI